MMTARLFTLALAGLALAASGARAEYVGGLDPAGDSYLSLRSQPSALSSELGRLGPNTMLEVIDRSGPWRLVRTQDGREGWAHHNWILPGQPAAPPLSQPGTTQTADTGSGLSGLGDIVPGSAMSEPAPAAPDWLGGHLQTFHDPLKYYP